MITVEQILEQKGREVWSIHPDASVLEAIKEFVNKDIGSLAVMDGGELVGIFTERLYARNIFLKGKSSPTTSVHDVMSTEIMCVRPDHTIPECMAIMTERKFRHLPVMEGDKVVGIISIGDLVESTISDQKFTIEQLEHYIRA